MKRHTTRNDIKTKRRRMLSHPAPFDRYLLFAYFGQPTFFRSASGRSAAFLAAGGRASPLGTSQISTRRFLASLASTSLPLRSLGASVDTVQEVGRNSVSCTVPTHTPLMREWSSAVQVPLPPLRTPAVLSTRSLSSDRPLPLGPSLASTWPTRTTS